MCLLDTICLWRMGSLVSLRVSILPTVTPQSVVRAFVQTALVMDAGLLLSPQPEVSRQGEIGGHGAVSGMCPERGTAGQNRLRVVEIEGVLFEQIGEGTVVLHRKVFAEQGQEGLDVPFF